MHIGAYDITASPRLEAPTRGRLRLNLIHLDTQLFEAKIMISKRTSNLWLPTTRVAERIIFIFFTYLNCRHLIG